MHEHKTRNSHVKRATTIPRSPSHCRSLQWRTFRLSDPCFTDHVEQYFIALDCPLSLSCLLLFRHGEWRQLVEKDVNPSDFNDAAQFRDAFAAISFLRKYPDFQTGIDKTAVALDQFAKCELSCRQVNAMIKSSSWGNKPHDAWLLNATKRKIEKILHSTNEASQGFDIDFVLDKCSWGPGSTLSIKGDDTSASIKFQFEKNLTRDLYCLYGGVIEKAYPGWIPGMLDGCSFVPGNQIVTVPKNAKTERTIAIEPGINSFVQSGIGRLIRSRLRSAGFNLNSDRRNQLGALKGSRDNSLATVDFSSASDTIATGVVEFLLPPFWFSALDDARSHYYTLGSSAPQKFEKFSTMGCGFTFELESLIFVAAALAVCECLSLPLDDIAVFGDDIIIPSAAYELYSSFCETLGFTVNRRKSFSTGYFRESCGSYYFKGEDVKPLFLKKKVVTVTDLVGFINAVRNLAHRRNGYYGCDIKLLAVWTQANTSLGPFFKGPRDAGDLAISSNFDEAAPHKARGQLEGYYYSAWLPRAVTVTHEGTGRLLAGLSSCGNAESISFNNAIPLRKVVRYSIKHRVFAPQWYDYGPWC